MGDFPVYFELGFDHILDVNGSDHILFVIAMIIIYKYDDWKNILYIITSFTIAHSFTLILAAMDLISINQSVVEALIAFTILITAAENIFLKKMQKHRVFLSGFFGLIHGMGFSNYFKSLVPRDFSIVDILFPFNVGIEVGQLVIVACLLIAMWILKKYTTLKKITIVRIVSLLIGVQSILWIIDRVG